MSYMSEEYDPEPSVRPSRDEYGEDEGSPVNPEEALARLLKLEEDDKENQDIPF
jgi:hypothetical protein